MQSLKGLRALIPFILAGCMILTGCSQEEALEGVTDVTSALFLTEDETTETAAETTEEVTEENSGESTEEGSSQASSEENTEEVTSEESGRTDTLPPEETP